VSSININKLAAEITESLKVFTTEVVEAADEAGERIGKEAVKKLKISSPRDSGFYAKSWSLKTIKKTGVPDVNIIHVKAPHYRLAHLLEHGHSLRSGGRTKAQPHIAPVEEEAAQEYINAVKDAIERG
jgi:hypothetical protein